MSCHVLYVMYTCNCNCNIVEKNIFTGPYILPSSMFIPKVIVGIPRTFFCGGTCYHGFYTQHTGSRSCPGVGGRGPNFFTYLKNIKMNQAFYILHLFYSNSKLLQSTIDAKVKKTLRVWK